MGPVFRTIRSPVREFMTGKIQGKIMTTIPAAGREDDIFFMTFRAFQHSSTSG